MELYKHADKPDIAADRSNFKRPGPSQLEHGLTTGKNLNAKNQMDKYDPQEIAKRATEILASHVAQSPQTQQLVDIMSIFMRKGPIYEQLAINQNGELNLDYVESVQTSTEFARNMAYFKLPDIQTTGELLEYLVGVKKNEAAEADDITRVSNTKWEPVFIGLDELEDINRRNPRMREEQCVRLRNSFDQIFGSMSKF